MILDETITLNSGVKIPKFALGTWMIDDDQAAEAVRNAIKIGYRHIDTAQAYGNERGVGEGVRTAGIDRDKIFVTSKVAAEHKDYDVTKKSIDETLEKMGLDYIDMMIIHSPQPWKEVNQSDNRYLEGNLAAWRAMEDAVSEGKIRTIGVSNFEKADLENIIKNSDTVPAVDQVLAHIGHTPFNLLSFTHEHDIAVEAYSPVAHGAALDNPVIEKMAKKYNELSEKGAKVIVQDTHVSGHASQEEIKLIYTLTKPKYAIPVHGEYQHLKFHAELAQSLGIPKENTIILSSGDVLEISEERASLVGKVQAQGIMVDGLGVSCGSGFLG